MPRVIFAVFAFYRPLITAPASLNGLDLYNSRNRDAREEDENLLFFKELILVIVEI